MFKISKEKFEEIAEYERFIEDPRLLQRINVIQMLWFGMKNRDVEKIKKLSHWTISAYRKAYWEWWIEGLLEWWCIWRVGKLSEDQKKLSKKSEKKMVLIQQKKLNIL